MLILTAALMGAVFSGDLLTLFIFWRLQLPDQFSYDLQEE